MQYCAAREAALAQLQAQHRVQPLWRALTKATDQLLAAVAGASDLTVLAVGGYGRGELFPFSDVDVLILVDEETPAASDAAVITMLQHMWDMQIPISHATRTPEETVALALSDSTTAAALMDMRLICGARTRYRTLKRRLQHEVIGQRPQEFVAAKLAERDRRHNKWGDSRFMLEPNVKEGKGGLRDLHTLNWLARYCYRLSKASELVREDLLSDEEWRHYREAYLFFGLVRAHMHALRGRGDDRLTFDLQTQIAEALKFPGRSAQEKAEKLMRRYFQYTRDVGALTRIFCAILEEEKLRAPVAPFREEARSSQLPEGFVLTQGRLDFAAAETLLRAPAQILELFWVAQQTNLDLHPRAQLAIARCLPKIANQLPLEYKANAALLEMLLAPRGAEQTLRRMNEMGVLGALLPEFGRIAGMMQYDGYHTYTVDEHTLVAVGHLAAIEAGAYEKEMPLATGIARELTDRVPLYLAMLSHDLAKGSGGQHAEKGEALVERIAMRMRLSNAQATLAAWLVKHHLLLSEVAFKRDLDDPKTIADFVAVVQSPERLRLLLLLTVADIKAVGPTIWNRWKGALMRDLFHRAMRHMGVGFKPINDTETMREVLLRDLPELLHPLLQQFIEGERHSGWWHRPREEQIASVHAYAAWQASPDVPALSITHDPFRAVSELTVCLATMPHALHAITGAVAWIGANIVSARSMVLSRGALIATLAVQDVEENSFADDPERLYALQAVMPRALDGTLDLAQELPKRRRVIRGREVRIAPSVFIDNQVSSTATVIEINARDRLGLLYDILGAFAEAQVQVMTAHIATYGRRAVDVFYVKDAYGFKLMHHSKREQLQRQILAACEEPR
jgi:[protein-PII] uridylyltransferase